MMEQVTIGMMEKVRGICGEIKKIDTFPPPQTMARYGIFHMISMVPQAHKIFSP
jgi:hypothetical protein